MTNGGTTVNQRDIVFIHYPFTDLTSTKKRPAVVLSNSKYHSQNEDLICCAITSNPREYANSVKVTNTDLESGNLKYDSRVKPNKIFSLYRGLVIKTLAKLNIARSKEIIEQLDILIEIEE